MKKHFFASFEVNGDTQYVCFYSNASRKKAMDDYEGHCCPVRLRKTGWKYPSFFHKCEPSFIYEDHDLQDDEAEL